MQEIPLIAIYRMGTKYRVEINGKAIERLRSFEVKVSNELARTNWPTYRIEQFLPHPINQSDKQKARNG